jgi:hypothetical protein
MKTIAYLYQLPARLACTLNRKTCYWNRTSKLTALMVFCLLFGGMSLYLFLKAIL